MKIITKTYNVYEYQELSYAAKEKVQRWYLDDPFRADAFKEDVETYLQERFPRSDLKVYFSLNYSQGDGLNIEGRVNLYDFVEAWDASEKEKRAMIFYLGHAEHEYTFESNRRYYYSCKFIDKKYIDGAIEDFIEDLKLRNLKNINAGIIKKFFNNMIDHFDALDYQYKEAGYNYIYEIDEDELIDACAINEWYFDIFGNIVA